MFVGEKLTNIRLLYGLSRQDLASKLGVTEQSIWQYENGYTSPSLEKINELKNMFFLKESIFIPRMTCLMWLTKIILRIDQLAMLLIKEEKKKLFVNNIERILTYMEQFLNYPKSIIVELRNYSINQKKRTRFQ
ncbi:helix-turn-helix domain-containing protein [Bacillus cereus]